MSLEGTSGSDLPKVHVLAAGYSYPEGSSGDMKANCSCVLITGEVNVIVDTMTAWDKEFILTGEIFFLIFVTLFDCTYFLTEYCLSIVSIELIVNCATFQMMR